ncbi:MAG: hypothetical protein AB8B62_00425 [Roseobacter sp.]
MHSICAVFFAGLKRGACYCRVYLKGLMTGPTAQQADVLATIKFPCC